MSDIKTVADMEQEIDQANLVRISCEQYVRSIASDAEEDANDFSDTYARGYKEGMNAVRNQAKRFLESLENK